MHILLPLPLAWKDLVLPGSLKAPRSAVRNYKDVPNSQAELPGPGLQSVLITSVTEWIASDKPLLLWCNEDDSSELVWGVFWGKAENHKIRLSAGEKRERYKESECFRLTPTRVPSLPGKTIIKINLWRKAGTQREIKQVTTAGMKFPRMGKEEGKETATSCPAFLSLQEHRTLSQCTRMLNAWETAPWRKKKSPGRQPDVFKCMFRLVKQHMASDGYHRLLLLPLFSAATDLPSRVPAAASPCSAGSTSWVQPGLLCSVS